MWRVKDFQIHSKEDLGMMDPAICLEKAQANKESVKVFLDVEKTCGAVWKTVVD